MSDAISTHRLIQAACDELATPDQYAELERRVLADPAALAAYVDAMNVHASLAWDALEAVEADQPVPLSVGPAARPRSRRGWTLPARRATLVAAVLCVVVPLGVLLVSRDAGEDAAGGPAAEIAATDLPTAVEIVLPQAVEVPADRSLVREQPGQLGNRVDRSDVAAAMDAVADAAPPVGAEPETAATATTSEPSAPVVIADRLARIDAAIAQRLVEEEVQPSPRAADSDWLRRASLDLRGRIPTPAEIDRFLAAGPDRREAYISEATASREFADQFGSWWAGLLVGHSAARQDYRTRLRTWIADEVDAGAGWSDIAGELIAARGPEQYPPTNFLLAHLNNQAVPATAITSRVLLGRQVQCTQCHAHPWNGASQDQFWQLNAFFKQAEVRRDNGIPTLADRTDGGPVYYETLGGVMQVAYPAWNGITPPAGDQTSRRDQLTQLLQAERVADGSVPALAEAMASRLWDRMIGAPLAARVDDLGPHAAVTHPEVLAELAAALVEADYDIPTLARLIASTEVYQRSSVPAVAASRDRPEDGGPALFSRTYVKPLSAEQIYDSIVVASRGHSDLDETNSSSLPPRDDWVSRFYQAQANDENSELSTFDGSVNQALSLMNGDLVDAAVAGPEAAALNAVLASDRPPSAKLDQVLRLSLGRVPTESETLAVSRVLTPAIRRYAAAPHGGDGSSEDGDGGDSSSGESAIDRGLRDVFWACLNSNRFALNY